MEKLAAFIVDKRNLFFLLYIFALIFSVIASGWVKVEDDITTYLPDTTETRQGLTVMNDNFVTYGTANVMVSNITYDTALDLQAQIEGIEGVSTVEFDDTKDHYNDASALFSVSRSVTSWRAATIPRSTRRSATIPRPICRARCWSSSSSPPSSLLSC